MNWIPVSQGYMALRGKPGRKFFGTLSDSPCTRIVTLLAQREGAMEVGNKVQTHNLIWTWLPLENAQPPVGNAHHMLCEALPVLADALHQGEGLMIHCAAGIHRTGMVAYALLRVMGLSVDDALAQIAAMRQETRDGMRADRLQWAEEAARICRP
jgi:protein-tyrosine phosphatase